MLKKILIALALIIGCAYADTGFYLYKSPYQLKDAKDAILKATQTAGFVVSDEKDLANAFKVQFGQSDFDAFYNITVLDVKTTAQIAKTNPKIAAFTPFTILLYKKTGTNELYWGFVNAKTVKNSIALSKAEEEALAKSQENLVKNILSALPKSQKVKIDYNSVFSGSKDLLYTVSYDLKKGEDINKRKEDIYKQLESDLEVDGFKISNFTDILNEFGKAKINSDYDIFETYSICKLKVIYAASKERPEAGVFAPCDVFFIKRKNEDKLLVGFPPTQNWVEVTQIKNTETISTMKTAEDAVKNSLESSK